MNFKELTYLNNIIEFKNVNFGYAENKIILKNVSFKIPKNKYICIIGHNGSGKSTISKILIGLLKPWSGSVSVEGQILNIKNLKYLYSKLGLVFQNPDNQFIGLTAEDDIAFGLENQKVPPDIIKKIINNVASALEIEHLLQMNAHELSGGEKQKVAIASVLAVNPKIIIFDEATSMLDSKSKKDINELMRLLVNEGNKTIISITHDMEELNFADEIIVMDKGEVLMHGEKNKIFADKRFFQSNLDLPFFLSLKNSLISSGINVKNVNDTSELITKLSNILKSKCSLQKKSI